MNVQGIQDDSSVAEPRWLTPEEQEIWVAFLIATRLLWSQFERDLQRKAQLPQTYYEILSMLSEVKDRTLALSSLSTLLQLSPSRLSHALSRMEETGWIRREMSAVDRRKWRVVLADEGMEVLLAAAPIHIESVRTHLLDQLTPAQLDQLGDISQAVLAHLVPGFDLARALAQSRETGRMDAESMESLSHGTC